MLIWANKNEINDKMMRVVEIMYAEKVGIKNTRKGIKAWELSVILRQIREHFGERKDISILDFGAGVSPFGAYLNHIGYRFVTCADKKGGWHPEINQEIYNKKYGACVEYVKTDIVPSYDKKYDVIFSASVLEHIRAKERVEIMRTLSQYLKSGGLVIHAVDYDSGVNFKKLIEGCGIPISHKLEETPGCKEFKAPPEYTWWTMCMKRKRENKSCVAFFNEEKNKPQDMAIYASLRR